MALTGSYSTCAERAIRTFATLSCFLGFSACTQTNAALMDNSIHLARTCPDGVRLYSSPSKVGAEYEEVALLNSTGLSNWTTESGMMKSMREKAAEVGATGIIMGNIDEASSGAKVAAQVFGTYTERKGKSVAIYVAGDEDRIQAVCGVNPRSASTPKQTSAAEVVLASARQSPPQRPGNNVQHAPAPEPSKKNSGSRAAASTAPVYEPSQAQATIGAPRSESDRSAAVDAFNEGKEYVGSHDWALAEQSFQKAILLDGSTAKYHAAMGSLMMLLHRWTDAEASYSAAVLLDVDNVDYHRMLKEARARR